MARTGSLVRVFLWFPVAQTFIEKQHFPGHQLTSQPFSKDNLPGG